MLGIVNVLWTTDNAVMDVAAICMFAALVALLHKAGSEKVRQISIPYQIYYLFKCGCG